MPANNDSVVHLYYTINQFSSIPHHKALDSLSEALKGAIYQVKILGYADYLHTNAYNKQLSEKRAKAVKVYLLDKSLPNITITECKGFGELKSPEKGSKQGEAAQRRVDLIIKKQHIKKRIAQQILKTAQTKDSAAPLVRQGSSKHLTDLQVGKSLVLEGLSFIPGRHVLVKGSMPVLTELLATLKNNPELTIEIQGHVCCADGEEDGLDYDTYEHKLSLNRAKVVYDFLVKNGIDAARLTYKGYGHTRPKIEPETSPEEEQINRRVEIMLRQK